MAEPSSLPAKVFAVPELLEDILLNLSPRTLFGVERVDRTFRDTIAGSKKLQRAMLLLPSTSPSSEEQDPNSLDGLNPVLLHSDILYPAVFTDLPDESFFSVQLGPTYLNIFIFKPLAEAKQALQYSPIQSWRKMLFSSGSVRIPTPRVRLRRAGSMTETITPGVTSNWESVRTLEDLRLLLITVINRIENWEVPLRAMSLSGNVKQCVPGLRGDDRKNAEMAKEREAARYARVSKESQEMLKKEWRAWEKNVAAGIKQRGDAEGDMDERGRMK